MCLDTHMKLALYKYAIIIIIIIPPKTMASILYKTAILLCLWIGTRPYCFSKLALVMLMMTVGVYFGYANKWEKSGKIDNAQR